MNWEVVKDIVAYAREHGEGRREDTSASPSRPTASLHRRRGHRSSATARCTTSSSPSTAGTEVNDRFRVDAAGNGSYDAHRAEIPAASCATPRRQGTTTCAAPTRTTTPTSQATSSTWPTSASTELSMEPVVCAPDDPCRPHRGGHPRPAASQYELLAKEMLKPQARGQAHHLLPLHDRPQARPLHLQARLRLRQRH